VKSSAPGGSFFPRRLIREKSTLTTGLVSLLIATFRFRHAGNTNEGMTAMPSPASTMESIVHEDRWHNIAFDTSHVTRKCRNRSHGKLFLARRVGVC
jgi:hypothetical protein